MARNEIPIDWDKVEKAAMAGANGQQIAAMLGVHYNTLVYKAKEQFNCDFSEYLQEKRAKGDNLLITAQYKQALDGNTPMLIWLGKQRLGQVDKKEIKHEDNAKPQLDFSQLTDEELRAYEQLTAKCQPKQTD